MRRMVRIDFHLVRRIPPRIHGPSRARANSRGRAFFSKASSKATNSRAKSMVCDAGTVAVPSQFSSTHSLQLCVMVAIESTCCAVMLDSSSISRSELNAVESGKRV